MALDRSRAFGYFGRMLKPRTQPFAGFAAVFCLTVAFGCGGGGGDDADDANGGGGGGTGNDPCTAYADATVAINARCAPGARVDKAFEAASCQLLRTLPGSGFTNDAIAGCIQAMNAATCNEGYNGIPACEILGQRTTGMPCDAGEQCATGRCTGTADACGSCAPVTPLGSACSLSVECGKGNSCVNKVCAKTPGKGEPCFVGCSGNLTCTGGKCADPLPKGSACTTGSQCEAQLLCAGGKCGDGFKAGEFCDELGDECVRGTFCQNSKCVELLKPGAPCMEGGPYCSTLCELGKCKVFLGYGEACKPSDTCNYGDCVDGKCTLVTDCK